MERDGTILIMVFIWGTLFYMLMMYLCRTDRVSRIIYSGCIPVATLFAFVAACQTDYSVIRFMWGYIVGLGVALVFSIFALVFSELMGEI